MTVNNTNKQAGGGIVSVFRHSHPFFHNSVILFCRSLFFLWSWIFFCSVQSDPVEAFSGSITHPGIHTYPPQPSSTLSKGKREKKQEEKMLLAK